MSVPSAKLTAVTLGVRDLPVSARFYQALGFEWKFRATGDGSCSSTVAEWFWRCGIWINLRKISGLPSQPQPHGFRGATFAWNCATSAEVDAVFSKAVDAGATSLRQPETTDYGGYRGYFSDPDGHAWEVVKAPGFAFTEDGRLILPE